MIWLGFIFFYKHGGCLNREEWKIVCQGHLLEVAVFETSLVTFEAKTGIHVEHGLCDVT